MGKDQRQKRKGRYYQQGAKKARFNKLDSGMRGIMITCNNREREAIKEAYNLLGEYADILYGPENAVAQGSNKSGSESEEEEDIAEALKKEVDSLKKSKPSQRRFQQVDTGTRNIIFVKTTLEDPSELVNKIFSDCYNSKEKKSRYINRMMPVLGTCSANDDQITKTVTRILKQFIGHGKPTSYCFQIKIRNNDGMSRMGLIPVLGRAVEDLNPYARVDLSEAEHNITIDVMKTVACIGCVQDYIKYRKYNLQEVATIRRPEELAKVSEEQKDQSEKEETVEESTQVKCEEVANVKHPEDSTKMSEEQKDQSEKEVTVEKSTSEKCKEVANSESNDTKLGNENIIISNSGAQSGSVAFSEERISLKKEDLSDSIKDSDVSQQSIQKENMDQETSDTNKTSSEKCE